MSEADSPWAALASRVVRVILARRDFSYAQLSDALSAVGVTESERSLASRVSRGRIKAGLLLQILTVTKAEPPRLWDHAITAAGTWDQRAAAVVEAELSRHPTVTIDELAQRMARIGAHLSEKTLTSHLSEGTLSLPELLQCLLALGSSSLQLYVDYDSLLAAAVATPIPAPLTQSAAYARPCLPGKNS